MNFLLDVNVLVAWGWSDHLDHERTVRWIAMQKGLPGAKLFTSPIPEIGFVRVSVQRVSGRISLSQVSDVLRGMLESLGTRHGFLPDDLSAINWPEWCSSAARTTDAHLFALAQKHDMRLATLDAGIPGAFLLPE